MSDASYGNEAAAILAGQVVGARGVVDFGDAAALADLEAIRDAIVLPALATTRSRMMETPDETVLIRSRSAADAIACASAIQSGLAARNGGFDEDRRWFFKFGIDMAGGVEEGAVATALSGLCEPGGICVTAPVEERVRGRLRHALTDWGERPLGPEGRGVHVFRLSPRSGPSSIAALLQADRPTPAAQQDVGPGTVLNDTFEIDDLIGKGGMGEVYRGHEIHSGGAVAIKLIRLDMTGNKVALGLFQKEALVLKDIQNDAIVRYSMFSFDPHLRRYYLAMELVDGTSLADLAKRGPLPFETVSALRQRVASGLFVAHERGIIHRDVSPDNIIIPSGGVSHAKIIDFGIARAAEIGGGTLINGGFAGKYNYVSPEQLGLAGGEVTAKSDIYSLGLVLAGISLGQPLEMDGTQVEVIEKRRVVPDLAGLDPRLRPLIERMLQPAPDDRPASMAEVAAWTLEAPSAPAGPKRKPPPSGKPAASAAFVPKPERRPERWIIGGALGLAVVFGLGIAGYEMWSARTARPASETQGQAPEMSASTETPPAPATEAPPAVEPPPATTDRPAPDQASLPPLTKAPPLPTPPEPDNPMAAFVRGYAEGSCFLAEPVKLTASSAAIVAFGVSRDDFTALDGAFSKTFGFAPDIVGGRIWSHQCPALDFLRNTATDGIGAPKLLLKSSRVARGGVLTGEIRGTGQGAVALLQVQEDGTVLNVSKAMKPDGDAQTFDLVMPRDAAGATTPQLLLVVSSRKPLAALSGTAPVPAETLFKSILDEAAGTGASLTSDAKLFLLGG